MNSPFAPTRRRLDEVADAALLESMYARAHRVTSMSAAADLVLDLLNNYEHSMETIVHVVAVAAVAAATVVANGEQGKKLGMDQSVMAHNLATWKFIEEFGGFDDGPKRLLQYGQMLYPQTEKKFEKTIDKPTMAWLERKAKEILESGHELAPKVRLHLECVSVGIPPFGHVIEE